MTAVPVSAAVLRDRADAAHAAIGARDSHSETCTKPWCARCTALARAASAALQSAMDTATDLGSVR